MRTRTILALGVLLAAITAGCAKPAASDPGVATAQSAAPGASPTASRTEDPDAPLKYSKCMREHGMTWFPDPSNGQLSVRVPDSVKKEDFNKAEQACRQWAPNGENAPKPSAEDLEIARQMAKCMRENGVPNFPDPQPDGGIAIDSKMGIDPNSPSFQAAQKKCDKYRPKGPGGQQGTETGGGEEKSTETQGGGA
ncbi:hypothetical protein [Actinoplanes sp. L3-i22]|uniref:hypothetical protein n=1 Tax=Actinoplanes sp. L3-i22 TaxID=2836373 RepID=UPI001C796311|nr:hypothetical protein [Actinoplanes sp. L3-i22]BCY06091.1 hypothetical protein L3i22_011790 [Actinoplanes sp. L3-i22]